MLDSHPKHTAGRGGDLRQHGHCANTLCAHRRDGKRALSKETAETRQSMKRELTCWAITWRKFPESRVPNRPGAGVANFRRSPQLSQFVSSNVLVRLLCQSQQISTMHWFHCKTHLWLRR